jgi:hypothetical protein
MAGLRVRRRLVGAGAPGRQGRSQFPHRRQRQLEGGAPLGRRTSSGAVNRRRKRAA